MKAYLYLLLCVLLSFQSHAQLSMDWATAIFHSPWQPTGENATVQHAKIVTDHMGNIYTTGRASSGYSFDLYMGDADLIALGDRLHKFFIAQLGTDGHPNWFLRFTGNIESNNSRDQIPFLFPHPSGGVTMISLVTDEVIIGEDTLAILSNSKHLLIAHLNPDGALSSHTLTRFNASRIQSIQRLSDGNFVVAGQFRNGALRVGDQLVTSELSPAYVLANINGTSGATEWVQSPTPNPSFSNPLGDPLLKVLPGDQLVLVFSPGGYQIRCYGCPEELRSIQVYRIDGQTGSTIWEKEIGRVGCAHIRDITELPNGDLYLVGSFSGELESANGEKLTGLSTNNCSLITGCLFKMTDNGDVYDVKVSKDGFTAHRIIHLANQQYLLGGSILSESVNEATPEELSTGYVLKLYDQTDKLLYQENLTPRSRWYNYLDVQKIDEQHIACSGTFDGQLLGEEVYYLPNLYAQQSFVAKLTLSDISIPPGNPDSASVDIFPNPTSDLINIDLGDQFFGDRLIQIFNIQGQQVFQQDGIGERSKFNISIDQLAPGIYFLQLGEDGPRTKIIKLGQR